MPRPEACLRCGVRTGANRRGLSPKTLAKWLQRRAEVFQTWLEVGCSYAEAGRKLRIRRQTVRTIVKRVTAGWVLAVEAGRRRAEYLDGRRQRRNRLERERRRLAREAKQKENGGE